MPEPKSTTPVVYTPVTGVLLRIYWLMLGHTAALLFTVLMITKKHQPSILWNCIFLLFPLSLAAARYVDIKYYKGETADGNSATMANWKSWVVRIAGLYVLVFAAIHISSFFIKS